MTDRIPQVDERTFGNAMTAARGPQALHLSAKKLSRGDYQLDQDQHEKNAFKRP
jgi:hypothetical protein